MNRFRIRTDLERARLGDFALPLGLEPIELGPPEQGYVLDYVPAGSEARGEARDPAELDAEQISGDDDARTEGYQEEDAYRFHVVVSHERLRSLLGDLFAMLGEEVDAVVEIGARDAYRATDVYWSREPMLREQFMTVWAAYEPVLLEDGMIGAGATCEDPEIEIFLDEWKGITVHAPIALRGEIERVLAFHGLRERAELWPEYDERNLDQLVRVRSVLLVDGPYDPDIDEVLFQLRTQWNLELDVDPEVNLDESGRDLGLTLWYANVLLAHDDEDHPPAYLCVWATARHLDELRSLIERDMHRHPGWVAVDFYTVDRVAFDERPPELGDLPPRRTRAALHWARLDTGDDMEQQHEHGSEPA